MHYSQAPNTAKHGQGRQSQPFRKAEQPRTDSLESDIKVMMEKLKELENKIQERHPRTHPTSSYSGQIHSIEELYEEDIPEQGAAHEKKSLEDDFGMPHSVDACYAQVNMTETEHQNTSWFLDLGASHHVSREKEVFTTMRASSGTRITTLIMRISFV